MARRLILSDSPSASPSAPSWRRSVPPQSRPPKVPRVRFLYVHTPLSLDYEETFQPSLHTFGYVVGQSIAIEERSASK
jgi:hypothetical protein